MSKRAKYVFLTAVTVFTVAFASVAIVQITAESAAVENLSGVQDDTGGYIVRDYGGYVGVYYNSGEEYPAIITEISLASLRQYDRELIETGFEVASRDELMLLLEDLGS